MRLDPYVGRVQQTVEPPTAVSGFHVERSALLAEVADREIQTDVAVKRRDATRRCSARRLDANYFSAKVREQPPAHLAVLVRLIDHTDTRQRTLQIRRHFDASSLTLHWVMGRVFSLYGIRPRCCCRPDRTRMRRSNPDGIARECPAFRCHVRLPLSRPDRTRRRGRAPARKMQCATDFPAEPCRSRSRPSSLYPSRLPRRDP